MDCKPLLLEFLDKVQFPKLKISELKFYQNEDLNPIHEFNSDSELSDIMDDPDGTIIQFFTKDKLTPEQLSELTNIQ